jgi:hypothetical protein
MNKYVSIEKLEENEPLPDAEITWIQAETYGFKEDENGYPTGEPVADVRIFYEALNTQYLKLMPYKEYLRLGGKEY